MKIIVVSVPGAGKSTILQLVKKEMPKVKIVNVGDIMFEIAKKKFKVKDRDEIRKTLSIKDWRHVQGLTYKKVAKMRSKMLIIDTHLALKSPHGYFPGLPDHVVELLKPDKLIVLEFNPGVVLARRKKDLKLKARKRTKIGTIRKPRKKRDIETKKAIEEHQKVNREYAYVVGNVANCAVKIVDLKFKQKKPYEHAHVGAEKIIEELKND